MLVLPLKQFIITLNWSKSIFSLAYLLVNYTYFKVNNVAIYPGLTYDNVLSLIYMFGILIVLLVVFLFSRWYTEKKK